MDDTERPDWLDNLAWQIDDLVNHPAAMKHFRTRLDAWKTQQYEQYAAYKEWGNRRGAYFVKMAKLPSDHELRTESAQPPRPGYEWGQADIHGRLIEAWLPPELAPGNGPSIDRIFPLTDRIPSLNEKYAALASIHDNICKGVPVIAAWMADTNGNGRDAEAQNRAFAGALAFNVMMDALLKDPDRHKRALPRFLRDVEADLKDSEATAARPPENEKCWIWPLRPLKHDHTPNMCCFVDDAPGSVVQMLQDNRTGAALPVKSVPPDVAASTTKKRRSLTEMRDGAPPAGGWRVWHRYYRPSEADLSIIKAAYPDDDPFNPGWLKVKRDLVCSKHDPGVLAKAEAPVLLGLLKRALAQHDGAQQRRPVEDDSTWTLGGMRQGATRQADELREQVGSAQFPSLGLAAKYTCRAFQLAVAAAQWTRGDTLPTVTEFVSHYAELRECRSRARDAVEGESKDKVWAHWPANPGTVYCWKADNSALAVAYAFARIVETEIHCNCPVSFDDVSLAHNRPELSQWRDNAIAGLAKHSLPPLADWPRWMIHRDTNALLCKLEAEHGQAVKNARHAVEAGGEGQNRGRPLGSGDTDEKSDRKIAREWKRWLATQRKEGQFNASFAQYAKQKHHAEITKLDPKDQPAAIERYVGIIKAAVDRNRKREAAAKAKRNSK